MSTTPTQVPGLPHNWMGFLIHCGNCGLEFPYNRSWLEPLSKVKVCGAKCLDEMQRKYAAGIVRKA